MMFCYQCQEALNNKGCEKSGVCGKKPETAELQDLLIYVSKKLSETALEADKKGISTDRAGELVIKGLFYTITNTNFDNQSLKKMIRIVYDEKRNLIKQIDPERVTKIPTDEEILQKAGEVGVLSTKSEDIRSLSELLIYGLKGMAAYAEHAMVLGKRSSEVERFMFKALATTLKENRDKDTMVNLVLECGEKGVQIMSLLDEANTGTYGKTEPTEVNIGVGRNPGILISGHDLRDLADLLEQTKDSGVDVYTHGEMLPAHGYPYFKKYTNFVGNYGGSWWEQPREFEAFNGPVLMTTNCIVPPRESYKSRIFTTGVAGFPGCEHIPDRKEGEMKDFSTLIELAKMSAPPEQLEEGSVYTGFGKDTLLANKDKIIDAVSQGLIKRFVVMAGCDGRMPSRKYYTELADNLPEDTIILTAGCAKYRYNKLPLGKIGDFPRVLDAGQCNDSYSLAVLALKLKETLDLDDLNKLPISLDIAWYEQKAVLVLLALLYLGFKNIRLGPTLPAFLSPNIATFLVENFDIKPIDNPDSDIKAMMQGS